MSNLIPILICFVIASIISIYVCVSTDRHSMYNPTTVERMNKKRSQRISK